MMHGTLNVKLSKTYYPLERLHVAECLKLNEKSKDETRLYVHLL